MSAFDDYIAAKKAGGAVASVAPGTAVTAAKVVTGSPFDQFIANKGGTTTPAKTPVPSASQHPLRWFGAQLAKPGNILANITEPIGKALVTGDASGFKTMPKNVWDVATGKSTRGYMEMTQEALPDNPIIGTVAGLGLSILADPLNVIGGGLTKVGRVAEILSKAEKAGIAIERGSKVAKDLEKIGITVETANDLLRTRKAGVAIEKGSKLATDLEKAGVTAEQLALGGTKVAQAAAGQRAFLKAGEYPLMSQKASAGAYKATGAVAEALKTSRPVSAVRNLFNTSTGNKAADLVIQGAKNFERYLEGKGFEEATKLRKDLNAVIKNQDEIIQFSNYLEKNVEPKNPAIKTLADRTKKLYNQYVKTEQMAGLPTRQHPEYVPHIPIPEKVTAKDVFSSKLWSTKVKAAESRDIIKFISEHGQEQIGTAKTLGLHRVPNIAGLNQEITWGQFKTIKDIETTLKHWGIGLEFKPQKILRGNATGYFDPAMKKIVIATRRPSLASVIDTVRHEITHSAHFQIAGNIDMMETMAKTGRSLRWTKAINTAKDAAREEVEQILLKTEGMSPDAFEKLPPNMKEYYHKPTELLACVGEEMVKDPAGARAAFPKTAEAFDAMRRENDLFDLVYTDIPTEGYKIRGDVYRDKAGVLHQAIETGVEKAGIAETKKAFGKPFFVEDPAFQLAWRAKVNAKAVASAKLFEDVKQFSLPEGGVEVKIPELKGFRFDPQIAKQLDAYHTAIQPEEINMMFKSFDKVQNWWKGQALLSPAYHLRNMVGNFWNNFLAGVKNPQAYVDAGKVQKGKAFEMVDDFGRKWTGPQILEESKRTGVVGHGQYKADIEQTIENEITSGNWNPFSQGNKVFRLNRKVGGAIEDNARLTNFMHQLKKGLSPGEAAMEVKKYLFDYEDLTSFERNVMKRFMPFYTFTRKNLPLQFENVVKQPGKFSSLERVMQGIESLGMGESPAANEKYLSDYIKNNTAMKVNYNAKDKSYNYLLLGNWLPAYQAFDFISQPTANMMGMLTPVFKTPGELLFNKSSFWKTTLDEAQEIEKFPGEKINFLGFNISKKTATFLKNFRILNDIDKANPGLIFGGTKGQESIFAKAGLPGVSLPLFGNVTPAQFKYTASGNVPGGVERTSRFFVGSQLASYKPSTAREFYNRDTDARIAELKTAIRDAAKSGDTERVKLITKQMSDFIKERGR